MCANGRVRGALAELGWVTHLVLAVQAVEREPLECKCLAMLSKLQMLWQTIKCVSAYWCEYIGQWYALEA